MKPPAVQLSKEEALKQAEHAKALGNEHFKNGRFAEAIGQLQVCYSLGLLSSRSSLTTSASTFPGQYSQAHVLAPSSPIYPLNRAQAHLKLANALSAERDCTTSLALDDTNPKAWFRRAVARRSLKDWTGAGRDLAEVVKRTKGAVGQDVLDERARLVKDEKEEREAKAKAKKRREAVSAIVSCQKILCEDAELFKPTQLARADGSSTTTRDGAPGTVGAVTSEPIPIPIKMVYPSPPTPSTTTIASNPSPPIPAPAVPVVPSTPAAPPLAAPPASSTSSIPHLLTKPSPIAKDPTASIFPAAPRPKSSSSSSSFVALQSTRALKSSPATKPATPSVSTSALPPHLPNRPKPTSAHALGKALASIPAKDGERLAYLAVGFLFLPPVAYDLTLTLACRPFRQRTSQRSSAPRSSQRSSSSSLRRSRPKRTRSRRRRRSRVAWSKSSASSSSEGWSTGTGLAGRGLRGVEHVILFSMFIYALWCLSLHQIFSPDPPFPPPPPPTPAARLSWSHRFSPAPPPAAAGALVTGPSTALRSRSSRRSNSACSRSRSVCCCWVAELELRPNHEDEEVDGGGGTGAVEKSWEGDVESVEEVEEEGRVEREPRSAKEEGFARVARSDEMKGSRGEGWS